MPTSDAISRKANALSHPFLNAMSRIASSVAIATTDGVAGRAGATISTLAPVSAEPPPSLSICLHHQTATAQRIQRNNSFAINILTDSQQNLAQLFADERPKKQDEDKFEQTQHLWKKSQLGTWRLIEALAVFDCRLVQAVRYQSHFVIIGSVLEIDFAQDNKQPLLYAQRSYRMLGDAKIK